MLFLCCIIALVRFLYNYVIKLAFFIAKLCIFLILTDEKPMIVTLFVRILFLDNRDKCCISMSVKSLYI